ncbi:MAG: substrate-binding domain-containing protein [Lachnospiraceae bacterium]|nr:substrate-binding domain-containing protein [Lachnospiraceae bacterium]
MKKLVAVGLASAMALSLTACGAKEQPAATTAAAAATEAATEAAKEEVKDDAKVVVFWYDESDVFLGFVRDAMNKEFEALGITPDNQFAANNQSTQIDQINTAIAGGADILVVNQVTSGASDTAEDILAAAGDIPVVFFNRPIGVDGSETPVLTENNTVAFIGTDAPEAGHMQGEMIGEYVVANFDAIDINKDGKISYAMMKGDEANVEAIYRTQYGLEDANAVIEAAGKPALVYFDAANTDCYQVDQGGAWSAAAAKEYMDTNFVSYNEANGNMIELVICNNDGMAEGVIASLQEKGYNTGDGHVVPVFGVDATDNAKALIADGAMTGTIKQDDKGMAAAVANTAKAILEGATPAEALASLNDDRFSIDAEINTKMYVAFAPYTGE